LLLASRIDPEAFTELYRRHAEGILRFFARRTLDPEVAADLTAETFAEAFASRRNYEDQGVNGVAWLYGIAKHRLGRFFRKGRVDADARRRLGMPERSLPPEDFERVEELADLQGVREVLRDALATLPAAQQAAMRLRVIDELGYDEIATELRCSEATARQRVSRGLRRVALVLEEGGTLRSPEVLA
jgi:RNA polymerase sigma-70 factor (ECF subfamily)